MKSLKDEVVAKNGVNFIVTREAAPTMSILEQSLDAIKTLVNDEEVVAQDVLRFIVTRGLQPQPL